MRELVQQILTPNPQECPSLHNIVDHAFFIRGTVPGYIPVSVRDPPPISVTSLLSCHKRTSLTCDRHVNLIARLSQIHPGILSHLQQVGVVRPVVSRSRSASSRRLYSPAVLYPHCSALCDSRSWLRLPVVLPFVVSPRFFASCKPRRRLPSRPPR